jgi:tetratricopeptide (TPR) repeat protein
VEVQDERESMTPAQRGARYRAAYEHGLGLVRAGDYAQALGAFEEAARLRPESADAVFNLAACHEAVGDPMRAISFYRRLLEQHPDDPDCHANLGTSFIKMYYREGTPAWKKMAREAWLRSLQLKPDQPDVRAHLERISQPE